MKLKRCPNLHYYDGDKYDSCPHCAGSTAAAAPKPVLEPAPVPQPEPEPAPVPQPQPQPEPESAPVPQPQPEPVPVPQPQPKPVPVPEVKAESAQESWSCTCGAENTGRFCYQCGSPKPEQKPQPAAETWMCSCGAENSGKFCHSCGKRREEAADQKSAQKEESKPIAVSVPDTTEPEKERERSLTQQINEVKYSGHPEDALGADEDGVTKIIFDELDDELVLGWLTVINTSEKGRVFTLHEAKSTIGRSDADHRVDVDLHKDRSVSRGAQAAVIYDPLNKKFYLQSTGGKTYVYINREILLAPAPLKAYDIIRLGETEMVFVPLCTEKFAW